MEGIALEYDGLLPFRRSPYSVNCDTNIISPPVSLIERFIISVAEPGKCFYSAPRFMRSFLFSFVT